MVSQTRSMGVEEGSGFGRRSSLARGLSEVGDHLGAFWSVAKQRAKRSSKVLGSEPLVQQLRHNAPPSDQVDHGDRQVAVAIKRCRNLGRITDEAFGKRVGQSGDAVDDDEGGANGERLDGGSAAGDDGGAGVVEGGAGVGNESVDEDRQRGFLPGEATILCSV